MNNTPAGKILIVDDTAENIALLTEILQTQGYQISAARDGERAIKIACHTLPDLILLDIMMPGIDGFETCRQLKNQPLTQTIPVIFISAKTDMDDLVRGFAVGGMDYINKPFHKEEIYARVANQIKIQRLNQQLASSEANMRQLVEDHQQQSDKLQQIVTLVIDGILELNHLGEIQQANPAIDTLFGYNPQALQAISFTRLLAEPYAQQYDKLFAGDQLALEHDLSTLKRIEIDARRHDGSEFPIEFSLMKIPSSSEEKTWLAVIHDITEHKNKEEKLRHLSYIDPLTSLANRRRFDEDYARLWLQGKRRKNQLAFIMIDIDFFKQFNDIYGHQAGDICLQQVAKSLKDNIKRPCDIVARIGGEEFAVILPDTSKEGVRVIAEQLRKNVQTLEIAHSGSTYDVVTISLGVAITLIGEQCQSASMLYQMADEALYQAKQAGRNKYTVF